MRRTIAGLALALASASAFAFQFNLPLSFGNVIKTAATAATQPSLSSCIASPPIVPSSNWCTLSRLYCGTTPEEAVRKSLAAGTTFCSCAPTQNQVGEPQECTYTVNNMPSLACKFTVPIYPSCNAGYAYLKGACQRLSMIQEDVSAESSGGRILRDEHDNVLSIEQPIGTTVMQAGNYDAFGRPGFVDEIEITWPSDGGILPDALSAEGTAGGVRVHWLDSVTIDQADIGATIYKFAYWPNGSLRSLSICFAQSSSDEVAAECIANYEAELDECWAFSLKYAKGSQRQRESYGACKAQAGVRNAECITGGGVRGIKSPKTLP